MTKTCLLNSIGKIKRKRKICVLIIGFDLSAKIQFDITFLALLGQLFHNNCSLLGRSLLEGFFLTRVPMMTMREVF